MSSSSVQDPCLVDSLPPQAQKRLMDVLETYLVELEQGIPPDPDQLVARHPDLAEPLRAYLSSLDFLHRAAAGFGSSASPPLAAAEPSQKRLGDYVIIREIGRGGMGIVYEAKQISLDRRVALKVLPFAAMLDRKQIARFENEARAAAQLHHTNIVPVFSVGCERGVHYYAMQYIEGWPLDLAIRELRQSADTQSRSGSHGQGPPVVREADPFSEKHAARSPDTWKPFSTAGSIKSRDYSRTVAELGIQAAAALHHAHEYGVIHRDVKPSNLLLDAQGKLWITDFGLARIQADSRLSTTGDVMGTVRYMSPEQAAGKSSVIDQRTDVYSLGITLYELLTLRDAFDGADRQEFLRRIEHEEPSPPRRINPAIPVDLETIVLKAISKSPPQRYATAEELADDLRRFLEGKPTLARRPTPADRAGKWIRRHKTVVASAVILMAIALVGFAVSTLLIVRAHSNTKAALAQADANYRQARGVVDRLGTRYAEALADVPGAEQVRRELLRDTLGYYQQFIELAGDDPALQADLAVTHFKAGTITERIGQKQKALAAYRRAKHILQGLVQDQPEVDKHRSDLALCHNNLGLLWSQSGKTAEAQSAYQAAIDIQKALIADRPGRPEFHSELALSYCNLGLLQSQTGRVSQAERSYLAAIAIQEQLRDDHTAESQQSEPKYEAALAISYNNLSFLYSKTDTAEAERFCRKALSIQDKLARAHPKVVKYQGDQALSYNNLGALQNRARETSGRPDDAEASYLQAIAIQQRLVRIAPLVVRFRRDLAITHNNLGRLRSKAQQPQKAGESFAEARATLEDLVDDYPNELSYRSSLGGVLNNQGMVLEQLDRPDEAADVYCRAIEHQRFALEHAAKVSRFREFLSKHYVNYGRVLRATNRWREAGDAALARRQLWPGNPQRLYRVAVELALAARPAADGGNDLSADEATQRQHYADQAVATLRLAIAAGFAAPEEIRDDPDLESVRRHPEFRELLAELTKPQGT